MKSVPSQKSDWHTQVKYDSEIPCVQMDFQFISGVAVWCLDVGVLMVTGKSPDNFISDVIVFICG